MTKFKNKNSKNRGQVMLLSSLIIGGSILAATSVAGYLMLLRVRQSTDITNSSKAITAASSGIDWALYNYYKNPDMPNIIFSNNSEVKVIINGSMVSSVGRAGNSYRAFELDLSANSTLP